MLCVLYVRQYSITELPSVASVVTFEGHCIVSNRNPPTLESLSERNAAYGRLGIRWPSLLGPWSSFAVVAGARAPRRWLRSACARWPVPRRFPSLTTHARTRQDSHVFGIIGPPGPPQAFAVVSGTDDRDTAEFAALVGGGGGAAPPPTQEDQVRDFFPEAFLFSIETLE